MTTHVDFTAVGDALDAAGFESMGGLRTQRDLLFDLGIDQYLRQVREALVSGRYGEDESDWVPELRALNALVDIRGLGDFRVAKYHRNAPEVDLSELVTSPIFPLPRLSGRYLDHLPYD